MGISRIIGKVFGYAGRKMTSAGAKFEAKASKYAATAVKDTERVVARPAVPQGPTLSEVISKQPKALPAPTPQQLAAEQPLLNTAKLTGYGPEQLNMSQVITRDGTHMRYYRKPGSDRVVFETATKGALRTERFHGANGDFTYLKSVGNEKYLVQKQGDLTFINKRSMAYDRGMKQQVGTDMVLDNKYGANLKLEKQYGTNGYRKNSGEIYFNNCSNGEPVKGSFDLNSKFSRIDVGSVRYGATNDVLLMRDKAEKAGLQLSCNIGYKPNVIDNLLSSYKA